MLSLRATLVAMSAARSGRVGWSVDRGVDLALRPAPPLPDPRPTGPEPIRAAEPASFLDPDEATPRDTNGSPPPAGRAADPAQAGCEPVASGPLRAWSRLPARPPRT